MFGQKEVQRVFKLLNKEYLNEVGEALEGAVDSFEEKDMEGWVWEGLLTMQHLIEEIKEEVRRTKFFDNALYNNKYIGKDK